MRLQPRKDTDPPKTIRKSAPGASIGAATLARIDFLGRIAKWGSALVPPLGALFGLRLAEACDKAGASVPVKLLCQRCESILEPGINCKLSEEKGKRRAYVCNYCSHRNPESKLETRSKSTTARSGVQKSTPVSGKKKKRKSWSGLKELVNNTKIVTPTAQVQKTVPKKKRKMSTENGQHQIEGAKRSDANPSEMVTSTLSNDAEKDSTTSADFKLRALRKVVNMDTTMSENEERTGEVTAESTPVVEAQRTATPVVIIEETDTSVVQAVRQLAENVTPVVVIEDTASPLAGAEETDTVEKTVTPVVAVEETITVEETVVQTAVTETLPEAVVLDTEAVTVVNHVIAVVEDGNENGNEDLTQSPDGANTETMEDLDANEKVMEEDHVKVMEEDSLVKERKDDDKAVEEGSPKDSEMELVEEESKEGRANKVAEDENQKIAEDENKKLPEDEDQKLVEDENQKLAEDENQKLAEDENQKLVEKEIPMTMEEVDAKTEGLEMMPEDIPESTPTTDAEMKNLEPVIDAGKEMVGADTQKSEEPAIEPMVSEKIEPVNANSRDSEKVLDEVMEDFKTLDNHNEEARKSSEPESHEQDTAKSDRRHRLEARRLEAARYREALAAIKQQSKTRFKREKKKSQALTKLAEKLAGQLMRSKSLLESKTTALEESRAEIADMKKKLSCLPALKKQITQFSSEIHELTGTVNKVVGMLEEVKNQEVVVKPAAKPVTVIKEDKEPVKQGEDEEEAEAEEENEEIPVTKESLGVSTASRAIKKRKRKSYRGFMRSIFPSRIVKKIGRHWRAM